MYKKYSNFINQYSHLNNNSISDRISDNDNIECDRYKKNVMHARNTTLILKYVQKAAQPDQSARLTRLDRLARSVHSDLSDRLVLLELLVRQILTVQMDQTVYVANSSNNNVGIINTISDSVIATVGGRNNS